MSRSLTHPIRRVRGLSLSLWKGLRLCVLGIALAGMLPPARPVAGEDAAAGKPSLATPAGPLAALVSADTPWYISICPAGIGAPDTFVARLLAHPDMADTVEPLLRAARGMEGLLALKTGATPTAILSAMSGRLEIAAIPGLPGGAAIIADLGPAADMLRQALPRLEALAREYGTLERSARDGRTVTAFTCRGIRIEYAFQGDMLLGGVGEGAMDAVFHGVRDAALPSARSLAESPAFGALLRARTGTGAVMLTAYVRVRDGVPGWMPGRVPGGMLPLLPEAALLTSEVSGDGFLDTLSLYRLDTRGEEDVSGGGIAEDVAWRLLDHIPADSDDALLLHIRPEEAWNRLLALALPVARSGTAGDQQALEAAPMALDAFERETDIRIAPVLAGLGPDLALTSGPSGTFAFLALRDPEGIDAMLDRLDAWLGGMRIRRTTYRGTEIRYWNRSGLPLPYAPCCAVLDGTTLVVAPWPHMLKDLLARRAEGDFVPLSRDEAFAAARTRVTATVLLRHARLDGRFRRVWRTAGAYAQLAAALPFLPCDPGRLPPERFVEPVPGLVMGAHVAGAVTTLAWQGPFGMAGEGLVLADLVCAAQDGPFGMPLAVRLMRVLSDVARSAAIVPDRASAPTAGGTP